VDYDTVIVGDGLIGFIPSSPYYPPKEQGMQLGDTVKDVITNFTGVVTGIVEYISGCNQALVTPRVKADGSREDGCWFDLQRLVVDPEMPRVQLDNGATPGADAAPPIR
jgi:hypothetical protein